MSEDTIKQLKKELVKRDVSFDNKASEENLRELLAIDKSEKGEDGSKASTESKVEMVTVPKSLLETLLQDVDDLKLGRRAPKVKRVTHHKAKVKLYEGKPVIGITKTWVVDKGLPNEHVQCRIKYLKDIKTGESDEKAMNYLDFLNESPSAIVDIIEQKAKEEILDLGEVKKVNPDPVKFGDASKNWNPGMIANEVISVVYTSKVKFINGELEGKVITISNEWLNM